MACELSCQVSMIFSTSELPMPLWADLGYQCSNKGIYHFLCRPLGEEVAVPQIVDLDILDVVAIGNVHLGAYLGLSAAAGGRGRSGLRWRSRGQGGLDGRDVDMLNSPSLLQLRVDPGRCGRCHDLLEGCS